MKKAVKGMPVTCGWESIQGTSEGLEGELVGSLQMMGAQVLGEEDVGGGPFSLP